MTAETTGYGLESGDGDSIDMLGTHQVVLAGRGTGASFTFLSADMPAGSAPPPHVHDDEDEAFYVLEGELTFQLGDELINAGQGELAFAPRGIPHTLANLSAAAARYLLVCTPAGFERYFDRMAAKEAGVDPPPEALEPWPEVVKVGPRNGDRQPS